MLRAQSLILVASLASLAHAQAVPAATQREAAAPRATKPFTNRAGTFRVELPQDWRQLAPAESKPLAAAVADLPHDVRQNVPEMFYAVGPVDRWLRGDFDGEYLYVVEQDAEWHLDGDLKARLQQMWDDKGADDGQRYEVLSATQSKLGADGYDAVVVDRRIHPARGSALRSLDLHVPTGGREITLCLVAKEEGFDSRRPELMARANSLTLARKQRGEATLSDRLWTPILVGAGVGLLFLVLYKKTRRPPA